MVRKLYIVTIAALISVASGNLDGPFVFFGPQSLKNYRRPALKYLDQDDLMRIYGDQAAIVVFNNQDPIPLSSGCFPRLRKMLEGLTSLVLPQDFLDVHPDYVSNETQVLTLQGPWSERDAQMTETFARLQDIYGTGRVLGILGNSVSQSQSLDYDSESWPRVRREVPENIITSSSAAPLPATQPATTPASVPALPPASPQVPAMSPAASADDDKPAKAVSKYALFNATGPAAGKAALLYSSSWPELRWANGSVTVLDAPAGEPTVKTTRLYYILVVRFIDEKDTREKITLEFSFKELAGWWAAVGVEMKRGLETTGLYMMAPAPPDAPSAVLGYSYHCSQPLVYSSENATLTLRDVQMQPYMENTEKFADAFDCIGFTTVPIWSGLMVTFIMFVGLVVSIAMIMDIKTMDKFDNNRGKQLSITVSE